jgi:hypothetical protein
MGTGDAPAGSKAMIELPAPGYPISEQSLTDWFRQRYGRTPSERELGSLMAAMAERNSTPPHEGPRADLEGCQTDPAAEPPARR